MKVKKYVDLSWEITKDTPIYPGDPEPDVSVATTVENEGYNLSGVYLGTQTGSHVDAPYHFSNDGATIDQMELDFFFNFSGSSWTLEAMNSSILDGSTELLRIPATSSFKKRAVSTS